MIVMVWLCMVLVFLFRRIWLLLIMMIFLMRLEILLIRCDDRMMVCGCFE